MSSTIKNEKGLNGSCNTIWLTSLSQVIVAKKALEESNKVSEAERKAGLALIDSLNGLKQQLMNGQYFWDANHNKKKSSSESWFLIEAWPSGWGNAQDPIPFSVDEIKAQWAVISSIRSTYKAGIAAIKKAGSDLPELQTRLPKEVTLKKSESWIVSEIDPNASARSGSGWAIWMGGQRELGYMDGKKRPAGAAAARLFESEAAALKTAKAARFGSDRGPAALVCLIIEPLEIVEATGGADEVRAELARIESESLTQALEEASLEHIREALGEGPAIEIPAIQEGSLAGADVGYALWQSSKSSDRPSGYINYNHGVGPLGGAILKASVKEANNGMWSYGDIEGHAIVKVRARPVQIGQLIGEPNLKELSEAIESELGRQQAEALAKADAGALKARAAALQSGEAQPSARRSRSL